jgi:DNA-binding NtrC family response regulator
MNQRRIIFVVDDEAMLCRALVRVLRNPLYELHVFENPIEALAKMDELRPELVVSDNEMPKMKGFDFLRKLRAERPGVRTLMLTGGHIGEQFRAAVAGGEIDHLLEKPWLDDQLRNSVHELLEPK